MILHRKNGKLVEFNEKGEIVLTPSQRKALKQLEKEYNERNKDA